MASDRTKVSGLRTGSTSPTLAQAVATGAQPAACPPTKRIGRGSIRPASASSSKPRASGEHRPRGDRGDDHVWRPPAERLRDLEGEGLAALGVVRPEVDVDEAPAGLVGDLEAQPVHVVVRAVDGHDRRAVRERVLDLGALEVRRARTRRQGCPSAAAAAAVAPARLPVEAQASVSMPNDRGSRRGDGHGAVLERERRVARVVLDPQAVDADRAAEAIAPEGAAWTDREAARRRGRRRGRNSR